MGVYSLDRHNLTDTVEIVADESFDCVTGLERMMLACEATDMAIFEAIIMDDMKTTIGLKEGTLLESEIMAIQEANIGGLVQTIKNFVLKFLEKLNGVVQSFIAKFRAHYEQTLNKAAFAGLKKKIYADFAKVEGKKIKFMTPEKPEMIEDLLGCIATKLPNYIVDLATNAMDGKDTDKIKADLDSDEIGVGFINKELLTGNAITELKEFKTKIMEIINFRPEATEVKKSDIDNWLETGSKKYDQSIKTLTAAQKGTNGVFKANMKELDRFAHQIRKDEEAAKTYQNLTLSHSVYSYGVRLTNMMYSVAFNIIATDSKYTRQTFLHFKKLAEGGEEAKEDAKQESAFIESYLEDVETETIDADFQY